MLDQVQLTVSNMAVHDLWQELREHIGIELTKIEHAIRNHTDPIGSSAETIYTSAEQLKLVLVPRLKQIAKAMEELEWKRTEERLGR